MALPNVTTNVLDGNLGLQPASNSNTPMLLGCCLSGTQNVPVYYGDQQTLASALGGGRLLELAAYVLKTAGGVVGVMPLPPTTRGGISAATKTGTGAETLTLSLAPHVAITITCQAAGSLGTAAFTFQLGSGAASQPVTSAASWSSTGYQIPGTYCTVVFTAGSYIAGGTPDIYTISTLGVVAHSQGAGPAVPTFTASPVDDYYGCKVAITTGGALGTMQFTYSLDGTAANTSAAIVSPGGGVYAIPNTGIVLTFAGTSTAGDYWTFNCAGPAPAEADVTAAMTLLQTTYLSSAFYSLVYATGGIASAAGWTTRCTNLESAMVTLAGLGVYARAFAGCPTVGTVLPNAGSVTVDSADTDAVVIAARQGHNNPHVCECAGDFAMLSPYSGLQFRRDAAWAAIARAAAVAASQDLGAVEDGSVKSAVSLYRDEQATPGFDAVGITSLRTFPGSGANGIYITRGLTGALTTSDYFPLANARVIDIASGVARINALPLVNSKIPTVTRNGQAGTIAETKAQRIEGRLKGALKAELVDSSPQDAQAVQVTVNRSNNLLATGNLIIAVAVQPFGYARYITNNIGMTVSAA